MQVFAGPRTQETSARITAEKLLLDQWEEAAAQVGRKLLVGRRKFDFSCTDV
jgi:hypothetical protein